MGHFFSDGGFFMYPVVLIGLGGVAVAVLQMVLARKINLIPLIAGASVWTLVIGLQGTFIGLINAFGAVASAPPDQKDALMAMAGSISLNPTLLALGIIIFQLVLGAVAMTMRVNLAAAKTVTTG